MTTTKPEKTVCVFCGSSFGSDPSFASNASKLGELLAKKNWGLVYGGGSTGLMGAVARGCATNGGYVHGIIPEALISRERTTDAQFNEKLKQGIDNHDGSTPIPDSKEYGKTTLVKDMHTRKRLMGQEADAIVALPGGYGTMEELMEMVTWHQLNIHNKPIVVYNLNGFYDSFLAWVTDAIKLEFVSQKNGDIIKVATTPEEVVKAIEEYQVPEGRFQLNWEST
ncbi:CIC11C00000000019 [Sungouiella intermedia]|uniref:CIC11C00000000019 n=1 Tax=Sungouiella intermedia TaxID=45354 RepID=A0A1L0D6X8_9ASCO|nr:CIC11C00000000019 [[Candida] intermedia]